MPVKMESVCRLTGICTSVNYKEKIIFEQYNRIIGRIIFKTQSKYRTSVLLRSYCGIIISKEKPFAVDGSSSREEVMKCI